jgi:hypothetical protein
MTSPAPVQMLNSTAPRGTPEAFVEAMAEYLGLAALHAELAQTYADAGDGVGLAYAMRKFAAYAKAALGTFDDLNTWTSQYKESGR